MAKGPKLREWLTYSNVMVTILAFIVLGGGAAFAALGKDTVGTRQLQRNAVKVGKIAPEAVRAGKLAKNAVPTDRIRDNAVSATKIAKEAVTTEKVANNAVSTTKLTDNSVTSAKILNGEVRAGDLGAIVQVQNVVNVLNNENGNAVVSCPAGTVVISGGGFTGNFGNMDLVTTIREGNGWRVEARNETGATKSLIVRAYCLSG